MFTPLLGVLAALALQPDAVAPASEASIERFMAVIPDGAAIDRVQWDMDADFRARLDSLNPDRGEEIEALALEYRRCASPILVTVTRQMLRSIARDLGEEKLGRMIAFYQSPDLARLSAIAERNPDGAEVSEADLAEIARISEVYPIDAFNTEFARASAALGEDEAFITGVTRCEDSLHDALAQRQLRGE